MTDAQKTAQTAFIQATTDATPAPVVPQRIAQLQNAYTSRLYRAREERDGGYDSARGRVYAQHHNHRETEALKPGHLAPVPAARFVRERKRLRRMEDADGTAYYDVDSFYDWQPGAFALVPWWVITCRDLTPTAKVLLAQLYDAALADRTNKFSLRGDLRCSVPLRTLAAHCGITMGQAAKIIKDAVVKGFVRTLRVGGRLSNEYLLARYPMAAWQYPTGAALSVRAMIEREAEAGLIDLPAQVLDWRRIRQARTKRTVNLRSGSVQDFSAWRTADREALDDLRADYLRTTARATAPGELATWRGMRGKQWPSRSGKASSAARTAYHRERHKTAGTEAVQPGLHDTLPCLPLVERRQGKFKAYFRMVRGRYAIVPRALLYAHGSCFTSAQKVLGCLLYGHAMMSGGYDAFRGTGRLSGTMYVSTLARYTGQTLDHTAAMLREMEAKGLATFTHQGKSYERKPRRYHLATSYNAAWTYPIGSRHSGRATVQRAMQARVDAIDWPGVIRGEIDRQPVTPAQSREAKRRQTRARQARRSADAAQSALEGLTRGVRHMEDLIGEVAGAALTRPRAPT